MLTNEITAKDLHAHYKATRARLWGPKTSNVIPFPAQKTNPEPTSGKIEAVEPEPKPEPIPAKLSLRQEVIVRRTARQERAERTRLEVKNIIRECAVHYGYSLTAMMSHRVTQPLAFHRQIAMYLCREMTTASFPMIGEEFDFRDHTTIMHAAGRMEKRVKADPKLAAELAINEAKIRGGAA
jgi:hypothetical protein